jgi:hypothetical protein
MPGHAQKTPVKIYPKGLIPAAKYNVSSQETDTVTTRDGADLMANGISFESVPDGELIYLNLPMHPGAKSDNIPPTAPSKLVKTIGTNMVKLAQRYQMRHRSLRNDGSRWEGSNRRFLGCKPGQRLCPTFGCLDEDRSESFR